MQQRQLDPWSVVSGQWTSAKQEGTYDVQISTNQPDVHADRGTGSKDRRPGGGGGGGGGEGDGGTADKVQVLEPEPIRSASVKTIAITGLTVFDAF